ncbi:MAG: hypothetical protein BWK76_25670 [Desulfobulbaceae bacterium A2]|nr:MAG: hypothetical protein BWK76_25670 [Desulfobulbaceae bacterium A2]
MTNSLPIVKAFVRQDGSATVVCPACGRSKVMPASAIKPGLRIKARCVCHIEFIVTFEFRRSYRKSVQLPGSYTVLPPNRGGGEMLVTDISRGGIKLHLPAGHGLNPGQRIEINFQLDDKRQSAIQRQVVVRHILGKEVVLGQVLGTEIGCEFIEHDFYDKVLGFYLNP